MFSPLFVIKHNKIIKLANENNDPVDPTDSDQKAITNVKDLNNNSTYLVSTAITGSHIQYRT